MMKITLENAKIKKKGESCGSWETEEDLGWCALGLVCLSSGGKRGFCAQEKKIGEPCGPYLCEGKHCKPYNLIPEQMEYCGITHNVKCVHSPDMSSGPGICLKQGR